MFLVIALLNFWSFGFCVFVSAIGNVVSDLVVSAIKLCCMEIVVQFLHKLIECQFLMHILCVCVCN